MAWLPQNIKSFCHERRAGHSEVAGSCTGEKQSTAAKPPSYFFGLFCISLAASALSWEALTNQPYFDHFFPISGAINHTGERRSVPQMHGFAQACECHQQRPLKAMPVLGALRAQAKVVGFVGVPKTPKAPAHVCACSLGVNVWP